MAPYGDGFPMFFFGMSNGFLSSFHLPNLAMVTESFSDEHVLLVVGRRASCDVGAVDVADRSLDALVDGDRIQTCFRSCLLTCLEVISGSEFRASQQKFGEGHADPRGGLVGGVDGVAVQTTCESILINAKSVDGEKGIGERDEEMALRFK